MRVDSSLCSIEFPLEIREVSIFRSWRLFRFRRICGNSSGTRMFPKRICRHSNERRSKFFFRGIRFYFELRIWGSSYKFLFLLWTFGCGNSFSNADFSEGVLKIEVDPTFLNELGDFCKNSYKSEFYCKILKCRNSYKTRIRISRMISGSENNVRVPAINSQLERENGEFLHFLQKTQNSRKTKKDRPIAQSNRRLNRFQFCKSS